MRSVDGNISIGILTDLFLRRNLVDQGQGSNGDVESSSMRDLEQHLSVFLEPVASIVAAVQLLDTALS